MSWFAKMIFNKKKREGVDKKNLLDKSNSTESRNKINTLISFFVLGLPFFIETALILNYPEANYVKPLYPSCFCTETVLELFAISSLGSRVD
jgi:hypothetical protein